VLQSSIDMPGSSACGTSERVKEEVEGRKVSTATRWQRLRRRPQCKSTRRCWYWQQRRHSACMAARKYGVLENCGVWRMAAKSALRGNLHAASSGGNYLEENAPKANVPLC